MTCRGQGGRLSRVKPNTSVLKEVEITGLWMGINKIMIACNGEYNSDGSVP